MGKLRATLLGIARRLLGDTRGVAAVELAVAAPVMMLLCCGLIDTSLYIKLHFDAAQTAHTVSDVISRYQTVNASDVDQILEAAAEIIGKSEFAADGAIILSSVARGEDADDPQVAWQCSGGGALSAVSRIGAVGSTAELPPGLTMAEGDDIIVAEVFIRYSPIFAFFSTAMSSVYKTAIFRPRLGALTAAPGC